MTDSQRMSFQAISEGKRRSARINPQRCVWFFIFG